jgi:hypothetical protein
MIVKFGLKAKRWSGCCQILTRTKANMPGGSSRSEEFTKTRPNRAYDLETSETNRLVSKWEVISFERYMTGLNIMIREILTFNANIVILCIKTLLVDMLTFSGYLVICGILADPVNNVTRCSAKLRRISSLPMEF